MKIYLIAFTPLSIANPPNVGTEHILGIEDAVAYYGLEEIMSNHGCHCWSLIQKTRPSQVYGTPVDEKDRFCQSWKSSRTCITKVGGICHGVVDTSYLINSKYDCDHLTDCQKVLCEIDATFSSEVEKFDSSQRF